MMLWAGSDVWQGQGPQEQARLHQAEWADVK